MHARAHELIRLLRLQPHPEGGYFAEVHRSDHTVRRADGEQRSAVTTILFLLARGQFSQWHRVAADETWHFLEGAPLLLHLTTPHGTELQSVELGPVISGRLPVHVVPAHAWQGAQPLGDFALVACTVAPGFEFTDFTLIDSLPPEQRPALPALPR